MRGQIEWPFAARAFQARAPLRLAPFFAVAHPSLDVRANVAPRAIEFSRDSGLVLAEQATDFRERAVIRVVIRKAQAVAWSERATRSRHCYVQRGQIIRSLGIALNLER